uniref:DUF4939 domain-containing protein n=1 Tax=Paramormyrops kingsleyae TaxID=1676925 RepID=A0A3B3R3C0_9TELE
SDGLHGFRPSLSSLYHNYRSPRLDLSAQLFACIKRTLVCNCLICALLRPAFPVLLDPCFPRQLGVTEYFAQDGSSGEPGDSTEVRFTISLLSGRAREWATALWTDNSPLLQSSSENIETSKTSSARRGRSAFCRTVTVIVV